MREDFTAALVAGNPRAAELVVSEAIDAGIASPVIDDELIAPAMRRVGELWALGEITVADEHLATRIALGTLALQREAFRVLERREHRTVMLAGVEHEQHIVGLEMAADLLAQAGYEVRMLGSDVPVDALRSIVERHRPDVFGFTVTMAEGRELLPLAVDEVRRGAPELRVIVGGAAAPEAVPPLEWLATVGRVAEVVETVDRLLHRAALN